MECMRVRSLRTFRSDLFWHLLVSVNFVLHTKLTHMPLAIKFNVFAINLCCVCFLVPLARFAQRHVEIRIELNRPMRNANYFYFIYDSNFQIVFAENRFSVDIQMGGTGAKLFFPIHVNAQTITKVLYDAITRCHRTGHTHFTLNTFQVLFCCAISNRKRRTISWFGCICTLCCIRKWVHRATRVYLYGARSKI